MSSTPRISLEQWRALQAVVDAGGYAQAAARLHKSQSAITYAVQKIEAQLNVKLFQISGRRARLTGSGEVLYRRAKGLLEEAESLEGAGRHLAQGWESELRLAVELELALALAAGLLLDGLELLLEHAVAMSVAATAVATVAALSSRALEKVCVIFTSLW